jgi:hypothetical protein
MNPPATSREHFRRSCKSKRRYADQIAALTLAVHEMEKHAGLKLDTYKCRYCHGWHLTRVRRGTSPDPFRSHTRESA